MLPSLKLTVRTWKWWFPIGISFPRVYFQVRTVSFRECNSKHHQTNIPSKLMATTWCMFWSSIFVSILLMEEILHHLGCTKPCKWWDIYLINWCRISSINSIADLQYLSLIIVIFLWTLVLCWCLKGQAFFQPRKTVFFRFLDLWWSMGILHWWQPEIRWGNQLRLVVPPIYDRLLCPSPVVGNWISEPSTTSFCCLYFCLGMGWKFTRFHKKIQHAANYKNWSYTITCRFLHHLSCRLVGGNSPKNWGFKKSNLDLRHIFPEWGWVETTKEPRDQVALRKKDTFMCICIYMIRY